MPIIVHQGSARIVAGGESTRIVAAPANRIVAQTGSAIIRPQVSRIVVAREGPPGVAGGAGAQFVHTQSIASSTWIVSHNLGARPLVQVFSPGGVEVEAEIVHVSVNLSNILFSAPATGTAKFIR